ncbi:plasmalemma vesicle associated protein a isoform X2 [Rhinichthys klamathensis goyatoka]|uniref:plasmalemma vesicle associated protein a isoform X2 n=1 Tax=Rhinichthys klamathensis goyatoka TaxID=3034132 RepID=UPI0024B4C3D4|nr:plasmalemma vesicle associated protein a isoform X2 [Rhinichthys klamathensis goyatoka]
MYNSGYSQANFGLAAKKMHKSKGKSCGYYMKIVFFFSSLIQSLIIASLVLFLVYGQPEHSMEEKRLQELDQSVSKLTMENFVLRGKEKNLTKVLNVTLTAKLSNDKALSELRRLANISSMTIKNIQTTMSQCVMERRMAVPRSCPPTFCPDPNDNNRRLQSMLLQSEEMLKLIKANFTQMMAIMKTELDNSNKDKDKFHLDAIELRRDKAFLEGELNLYQKKCKEDFVDSLRGIPNVTKEFLKRIDDFFSKHVSFQLTCDKQKNQLEDIRENCSSLSREVENKLQSYLNIVGNQFTKINGENAKYETENKRLKEDAEWCNQNRSAMSRENRKNLEQFQLKNDQDSEKLLLENRKLKEESNLKDQLLSVKEKETKMLAHTIETLNTSLASCKPLMRPNSFMPNPYGLPNMPNAGGTGLSSTGLSKPNMPGTGSAGPVFSSLNGAGSNSRLGSTGTGGSGLSRTGLAQTGISSLGGVSPGLTGFASAGSNPTATGNIGQSGTGSTAFSSAGSIGVGMGKPVVGGAGFGSVGSNPPGNGATLGGARTTAGGSDGQTLSQAQINLHLKELHRYLLPN